MSIKKYVQLRVVVVWMLFILAIYLTYLHIFQPMLTPTNVKGLGDKVSEKPRQVPQSKLITVSENVKTVTAVPGMERVNRNSSKTTLVTTTTPHVQLVKTAENTKHLKPEMVSALRSHHNNHSHAESPHNHFLVYLCDGKRSCGGWGDRQRGMAAVYFLARVINRQFRILMSTPCDLRQFYQPNRVQWQVRGDELVSDSNITLTAFGNKEFQTTIQTVDFNQKFPQKVVYLKTNADFYAPLAKNKLYPKFEQQWGHLQNKRTRFRWAWTDLMRPSQKLISHLEQIVGTHFLVRKGLRPQTTNSSNNDNNTRYVGNSTFICAHVRMGKNPTNPKDMEFHNVVLEDLPKLLNFMSAQDSRGNSKYFMASDSEEALSKAKKYFSEKLISFDGKILHVDRQRSEPSACQGFETALIDQLILSLCDILVLTSGGFGGTASFINNSTQPFYRMRKGVIEKLT